MLDIPSDFISHTNSFVKASTLNVYIQYISLLTKHISYSSLYRMIKNNRKVV